MTRDETNLNDVDLAQGQFRFRRGSPLHSSDLFPLRPPLRPPPRCLVIRPHIPGDKDNLVLLPASARPRLGHVLHLHCRVAGILVHNLQSTNAAL